MDNPNRLVERRREILDEVSLLLNFPQNPVAPEDAALVLAAIGAHLKARLRLEGESFSPELKSSFEEADRLINKAIVVLTNPFVLTDPP